MAALTCTPSNLVAIKACLNCLSERELKALIRYAFRTTAGISTSQVRNGAACYSCMSDKQMLVALTALILNQLVPTLTVNQLRNSIPCAPCTSDKAINAELLYLFCNYFQSTAV